MSVVVRMEMPTLEKGCKIAIGNEYMFCPIEARWCNFYELGGRCPSWRPIICQLPAGNGRLVDADEDVSNYITVWDCKCSEFGKQTVMAVDDMKYLPAIVPAEAERSEKDGR